MAEIQSKDILNEKSLEIILNFKPSDKHDKNVVNEILKLKGDIKKIITLLPQQEQEMLDLRYFQNLSNEKIAERINKPKDEVNKIVTRAVKNVKEKLGQENLDFEKVQKVIEIPRVIEIPNVKPDIREQNPVKQAAVQVQSGYKRRPSFFGFIFSLAFYAVFLGGGYFVVQKYFFHNLPTLNQLFSNSKNLVQRFEKAKPMKRKSGIAKSQDPYAIKLSGSSSLFGLARRWENAFNVVYPKYHVNLISSDSDKGISDLLSGKIDIANSSRPITFADRKKASENGLELSESRVALDALIIIANKKNPVNEISLDDLEGIFNTEIKSWKQISSNSFEKSILPVVREEGSGTNEFVINRILQGNVFSSSLISKDSNKELIKFVSENEGAISFINSINYPWDNKDIKYLKVKNYNDSLAVSPFEGQKLNAGAIRYGDYPLARYLYLITRTDAPKKIQDFVSWVLSKKGQQIVAYSGLISVSTDED